MQEPVPGGAGKGSRGQEGGPPSEAAQREGGRVLLCGWDASTPGGCTEQKWVGAVQTHVGWMDLIWTRMYCGEEAPLGATQRLGDENRKGKG
eukprot:1143820-Pelagomonas_calceolata.AAC.2